MKPVKVEFTEALSLSFKASTDCSLETEAGPRCPAIILQAADFLESVKKCESFTVWKSLSLKANKSERVWKPKRVKLWRWVEGSDPRGSRLVWNCESVWKFERVWKCGGDRGGVRL